MPFDYRSLETSMSRFLAQWGMAAKLEAARTAEEIERGCRCPRVHDSVLVKEGCPVHDPPKRPVNGFITKIGGGRRYFSATGRTKKTAPAVQELPRKKLR